MTLNDKSLAYALLRIALGVNFASRGLLRIHNGVGVFAIATTERIAKSPLPHTLIIGFSYAIPYLEAILGLTLILGVFTRISLACGAVFMMALTIGITANQQWDIVGLQLLYSLVFFVLLFLVEHNALAVDTYLHTNLIKGSTEN
jgi:thiosulfate dehydrogenase [quinone] large subunit